MKSLPTTINLDLHGSKGIRLSYFDLSLVLLPQEQEYSLTFLVDSFDIPTFALVIVYTCDLGRSLTKYPAHSFLAIVSCVVLLELVVVSWLTDHWSIFCLLLHSVDPGDRGVFRDLELHDVGAVVGLESGILDPVPVSDLDDVLVSVAYVPEEAALRPAPLLVFDPNHHEVVDLVWATHDAHIEGRLQLSRVHFQCLPHRGSVKL